MKCSVHPENEAIGVCVLCGSAVCHQCLRQVRGRILCANCYSELRQSNNPQQPSTPNHPKVRYSGCLVFLLSIIPGVGHLYLGHMQKGVALLFLAIVMPFLLPLLIAYSIFDCLHTARRLSAGEPVADWDIKGTIQSLFSTLENLKPSSVWLWGILLILAGGWLFITNLPSVSAWFAQMPSTFHVIGRNLLALVMVAAGGFLIWRVMKEQQ